MPRIATHERFVIHMPYRDHPPPHFHVRGRGYDGRIRIADGELMDGSLPRKAAADLAGWTVQHRRALLQNWERAQKHERLVSVPPPG